MIDKPIGEWMREKRELLGISQSEVAREVGVNPRTIDKIERGLIKRSKALPAARTYLNQQAKKYGKDLHGEEPSTESTQQDQLTALRQEITALREEVRQLPAQLRAVIEAMITTQRKGRDE